MIRIAVVALTAVLALGCSDGAGPSDEPAEVTLSMGGPYEPISIVLDVENEERGDIYACRFTVRATIAGGAAQVGWMRIHMLRHDGLLQGIEDVLPFGSGIEVRGGDALETEYTWSFWGPFEVRAGLAWRRADETIDHVAVDTAWCGEPPSG